MLANFESRMLCTRNKRETRHDYIDYCNTIHCDIIAGIIRKENANDKNNNQIVITVSSLVDSFGLNRLIDYAKYLEATAKSKATQSDADALADEANASMFKKNKKRFLK